MIIFLLLVITEILTIMILRQHYKGISKTRYYLSNIINVIFSIFLWLLYLKVTSYKGVFDEPSNIWLMMSLNGAFAAILFPRIILIVFHFGGRLFNLHKGKFGRFPANTALILWIIIFILVVSGTVRGRHNFKTEFADIQSEKLNKLTEPITIIHISDLHLASFHRHKKTLHALMKQINEINPDLIINTGDFISYGSTEYGKSDTILSVARARYGKYAVLGNHDMGTYHPLYSQADRDTNIMKLSGFISESGYRVLRDENIILEIAGIRFGMAGIDTRGRRLKIIYGDLDKASLGLDSTDFRILLSHDPNHWDKYVTGKTGFDLSLAGHTHGMQMGIMTKWLKWSPSSFFHRRWQGLYREGDQYLYVNRGLGVLALPFRIGMPPEITVIRLYGSNMEFKSGSHTPAPGKGSQYP